ncbi:hypothetical protein CORC01_12460 [Colletotrichum orchidophilum]|uniref:Uncharacterized protein n=1 Tax=Colletotrichum orchidophilum TaxID=1209926 RepID=A0A1G4AST6_9PEZI|nr:uncharacterized protein CORC01_12460 [Colletotrichum orchidophilum]OHE92224.1 hypothetical protein CORC01_12460 [Colletotrichum orchidophilum]
MLPLLLLLHDAHTMRSYSFTFKWPQSPHLMFLYCYPAPDTPFLTSCVQHRQLGLEPSAVVCRQGGLTWAWTVSN